MGGFRRRKRRTATCQPFFKGAWKAAAGAYGKMQGLIKKNLCTLNFWKCIKIQNITSNTNWQFHQVHLAYLYILLIHDYWLCLWTNSSSIFYPVQQWKGTNTNTDQMHVWHWQEHVRYSSISGLSIQCVHLLSTLLHTLTLVYLPCACLETIAHHVRIIL